MTMSRKCWYDRIKSEREEKNYEKFSTLVVSEEIYYREFKVFRKCKQNDNLWLMSCWVSIFTIGIFAVWLMILKCLVDFWFETELFLSVCQSLWYIFFILKVHDCPELCSTKLIKAFTLGIFGINPGKSQKKSPDFLQKSQGNFSRQKYKIY